MGSKLGHLLDTIDPSRTIRDVDARADRAINTFSGTRSRTGCSSRRTGG